MKILVVEDDDRIARPIAEDLKHQHYIVDVVCDGQQGWEYAQVVEYDLILLDLMLPKLDGITLCKRLRGNNYRGFILMITARDTTTDKVIGLDAGADDYLVKPFELEELSARIRAVSRRSPEIRPAILSYGNLQLNPSNHEVTCDGKPLALTPKEYTLLKFFLSNPHKVLTRGGLLDKLWELDKSSGEETIKTAKIPKKKNKTGGLRILDSIRLEFMWLLSL
jgi:DNA-binding response OmpR family regulator